MELPSKLQIDDKVEFIPMERHCKAMKIAKEQMDGIVVAVKFTKAKVWYDVLDDYHGKIFKKVSSNNVWLGKGIIVEPVKENEI